MIGRCLRRLTFALGLLVTATPSVAGAASLVMFETERCPWCAAWHRDVGQYYDRSDHVKILPLRRVDMKAERPNDLSDVLDVRYSPTFVVIACGREVDRILGYNGAEIFWDLMDAAVAKVRRQAGPDGKAC